MDFINANPPEFLLADNQLSSPENNALFNSAMIGSVTGVENAIKKGAKVNYFCNPEDQKTSLHIASENGFAEIVEHLLRNGAVVDLPTGATKSTALILAAQSGSTKVIELLLREKADVNAVNCYGNSALHIAAREGFEEGLKLLIANGANVNILNHKHSTPVHFLCYTSHNISLLKLLLDAKANPSIKDEKGLTPILACCTSGRNDMISLLMEYGADPTVRDHASRSAHDIAEFHEHKDIALRFGCDSPVKRFAKNSFPK